MPYAVKKSGKKWLTINRITGKVYGKHSTKGKAIAQERVIAIRKNGK